MTHRENILAFAAIVATLLAVLAFLGIRQYTDLLGSPRITSIKIGKGRDINSEAPPIFSPNEELHVVIKLSDIPEGFELKADVLFQTVGAEDSGKIVPGSERTWEVNDDGTVVVWYSTTGWATGVYKFEVKLIDRANQQRDRKAAHFRVALNE